MLLLDPAQSVLISALNWSEVLNRLLRHGTSAANAERQIARLGMDVVDFDVEQARIAAFYGVLAPTLSLADRACLAVSAIRRATAWTADRAWKQYPLDVTIELIRG
jgi:PIN domain nuclease of toxin-antitoxin system